MSTPRSSASHSTRDGETSLPHRNAASPTGATMKQPSQRCDADTQRPVHPPTRESPSSQTTGTIGGLTPSSQEECDDWLALLQCATVGTAKSKSGFTPELRVRMGYRHLSYGCDMETMVSVYAGIEEKLFVLHLSALCDVSPFFKKTLMNIQEGEDEKCLELPVTDPGTFKTFVEWLYSRQIILMGDPTAPMRRIPDLVELYIFADNYGIPQLERDTMDVVIHYLNVGFPLPEADTIRHAYENLPEDSPLCRLFVNEYARTGKELRGDLAQWPPRFVFDALNASGRAKLMNRPLQKPAYDCTYHQHVSEEEKEECLE